MIRKLFILVILCVFVAALKSYPMVTPQQPSDSNYIVYGTMRCPYTVKMVNELNTKNLEHKFVDVSTKEGNDAFSKAAPDVTGVPFTVNTTTGESFLGYRPM